MLIVIFGAGASFDSDPERPAHSSQDANRPPLAGDLFSYRFHDQLEGNPDVVALIPELRRAARDDGTSIERALETLRDMRSELSGLIPRQFLALRGYLREVVRSAAARWVPPYWPTNYVDLLNRLARWSYSTMEPVILVTFNYDTLLDRALEMVYHHQLTDMNAYVAHDLVKLIKVHGSTNWLRVAQGVEHDDSLASAANLRLTERFVLDTHDPAQVVDRSAGEGLVAAIAVPTITKDIFECPNTHLAVLEDAMTKASRLLVIGWRAAEDHFFEVWRRAIADPAGGASVGPRGLAWTYVVDRDQSEAQSIAARIATAGVRPAHIDGGHQGPGFSDFTARPAYLDELLARAI